MFNTKKSSIELFFDKVLIYFNMFCHVMMDMIVSYANCRCNVTTEKHRALHSIFNSFNTLLVHTSAHTPCPIAWNSYYALLLGFLPPPIVSCCAKLHDFPKLLYSILMWIFDHNRTYPIYISECSNISIIIAKNKPLLGVCFRYLKILYTTSRCPCRGECMY